MKISFVIGNGTSRKDINLSKLLDRGKVYGCNALYREFTPHYLIAVDTKMIREITNSKYHLLNQVWTNPNPYSKKIQKINLFESSMGWSSGPSALWLASKHKPNIIYILGFDYRGLGINHEFVNNIYAGTQNYKKKEDRATYHGNWARQTANIIGRNPDIKYVRVRKEKDNFIPDGLKVFSNLEHITVKEFVKRFDGK